MPFQAFATADGWLTVACAKEAPWRRLCVAIERPELADDPRFATFADRHKLVALLLDVFALKTTVEWVAILADDAVPSGPVNDLPAAFADPQTSARELLVDVEHPNLGTVPHIASPLRVGREPQPITRGPLRGEHTREVLDSICGYTPDRVDALTAGRVDVVGHAHTFPAVLRPAGPARRRASEVAWGSDPPLAVERLKRPEDPPAPGFGEDRRNIWGAPTPPKCLYGPPGRSRPSRFARRND